MIYVAFFSGCIPSLCAPPFFYRMNTKKLVMI